MKSPYSRADRQNSQSSLYRCHRKQFLTHSEFRDRTRGTICRRNLHGHSPYLCYGESSTRAAILERRTQHTMAHRINICISSNLPTSQSSTESRLRVTKRTQKNILRKVRDSKARFAPFIPLWGHKTASFRVPPTSHEVNAEKHSA